MSQPYVDLKIQIPNGYVPKPIMAVLAKGPGAFHLSELIQVACECGMKATLVIEQPWANA